MNIAQTLSLVEISTKWNPALATSLGIIIVIVLFFLLVALTINQAIIMAILSITPSAFLRVCGTIYSKNAIRKLKKTSNTMKTAAKAAIKDNQQAAYNKK